MSKQEIKDLIESSIKGQGNQVDLSGVLPAILNEIIDTIPTFTIETDITESSTNQKVAGAKAVYDFVGAREHSVFEPISAWEAEEVEMQEAITKYGLTDEVWGKFLSGAYNGTVIEVTESESEVTKIVKTREIYTEVPAALEYDNAVVFGNASLRIKHTLDGKYIISFS